MAHKTLKFPKSNVNDIASEFDSYALRIQKPRRAHLRSGKYMGESFDRRMKKRRINFRDL